MFISWYLSERCFSFTAYSCYLLIPLLTRAFQIRPVSFSSLRRQWMRNRSRQFLGTCLTKPVKCSLLVLFLEVWSLALCNLCLRDTMKGRSNELCRPYAEALLNLCREINVKGIDIWTAIQQQDDWLNSCFTWATKPSWYINSEMILD